MGVAERKAADTAMAGRMKHNGTVRTTSRCCICYKLIPTGSKKVNGVEILADVSNHVIYTCTGPSARKGSGGHTAHSPGSVKSLR